MMVGKVFGNGFETISKLDSYFLMTVKKSLHTSDFENKLVMSESHTSPHGRFANIYTMRLVLVRHEVALLLFIFFSSFLLKT